MKEFTITSSTQNSQYNFKNDDLIVIGNFQRDTTTGALMSLYGNCYANNNGEQGRNVGSFHGNATGEHIVYTLSGISLSDMDEVQTAIAQIEAEIIPVD